MEQVVVFDVEAQRVLGSHRGACRDADWQIQIVVRAVAGDTGNAIRQMTDPQAESGRPSPVVADEILADQSTAFHIPVLVSTLGARRRIANVQRVAVWRPVVGRDQEGRTPTIVRGLANEASRTGLEKPVLTWIE